VDNVLQNCSDVFVSLYPISSCRVKALDFSLIHLRALKIDGIDSYMQHSTVVHERSTLTAALYTVEGAPFPSSMDG
jgi:hypothetical protein